jgi:hypothetical protein
MLLNKKILDLNNGHYSFSDYFKMNIRADDLAKLFNYHYELKSINLKKQALPNKIKRWIEAFLSNYDKLRRLVNLSNEMAIREFLISPIIFELVTQFDIKVDIETSVYYSDILRGNIDYVLTKDSSFIAIEAKKSDINRGLNQLFVELIALDKIIDSDEKLLYGVVTTGTEWNFSVLNRQTKCITQDSNSLYISHDLETIFQLIISILDKSTSDQ